MKEIQKYIADFLKKCGNEAGQYKEASHIVHKILNKECVSEEELEKLREQLLDSLKIAGIGAYLIPATFIPFGYALLPLIVKIAKKYKINILPSSFKDK